MLLFSCGTQAPTAQDLNRKIDLSFLKETGNDVSMKQKKKKENKKCTTYFFRTCCTKKGVGRVYMRARVCRRCFFPLYLFFWHPFSYGKEARTNQKKRDKEPPKDLWLHLLLNCGC
nr:hypothetical protein [Pandoravirus aubagnensis]